RLTPSAEVVTAFLDATAPGSVHLSEALRGFLSERLRDRLPDAVWDAADPPPHLNVNIRIVDGAGRELASGRDLARLRSQLGEAAQLTFAAAGPEFERSGIVRWDFGDLPQTLTVVRDG